MTVIDSCILIDIMVDDQLFGHASRRALIERGRRGRLYAPDVVFSEVCLAYPSALEVEQIFNQLEIELVRLDLDCLYLAARTFANFLDRNRRSLRSQIRSQKRILPDFYIGALAAKEGIPLLTRDTRRKWTLDFPGIEILTP